jgi:hypothetical protein
MNSREKIQQSFEDYQLGRTGGLALDDEIGRSACEIAVYAGCNSC